MTARTPTRTWPDRNGHDPWAALVYWIAEDYEGRIIEVQVSSNGARWTDTEPDGRIVHPDTREPWTGHTVHKYGVTDGIVDPGLHFALDVYETVWHGDPNDDGDGSALSHLWSGAGPSLDDAAAHVWRLIDAYNEIPMA